MAQPVIYIHGYGSTGNTDTAVNLRRILANDFDVVSPTYDGAQPLAAARQLEALFAEHAKDSPIIVGTSLGGFFANYLSRVCNARAVIVNPSIAPSSSLHKYGENAEVLEGYRQLEQKEAAQSNLPPRVIVLGTRDEVVDPRENGMRLKGTSLTVMLDMGHRIEPAYYDTIAGLIRHLKV